MLGVLALALLGCGEAPSPVADTVDSAGGVDSALETPATDLDHEGEPRGGCAMWVFCWADGDGDAWGNTAFKAKQCDVCEPGFVDSPGDCDDTLATISPSAIEVCDPANIDENCNALVDDADPGATGRSTFYRDADLDGYGVASPTASSCEGPPAGYAANAADCNDGSSAVNPSKIEICDAGNVDENCAKGADDADPSALGKSTYYRDVDGDSYGAVAVTTTSCESAPVGYVNEGKDCNDAAGTVHPGAVEVPGDDVDQSCDGRELCYVDADDDDYGTTTTLSGDSDCNDAGEGHKALDCDDGAAIRNPGATEACDAGNVDEDCDSLADDNDTAAIGKSTWYTDADADAFGVGSGSTRCDASGTTSATQAGDCDDGQKATYPGALEVCDLLDNDCDVSVDEDVVSIKFYKDGDGDGYGVSSSFVTDCKAPVGYAAPTGDCKDDNAAVSPGRSEVCNAIDDDCDVLVDEGLKQTTWYADNDSDTFGDAKSTLTKCDTSAPAGYCGNSGDCRDTDTTVFPGATEVPYDGVDQDCDGSDLTDLDGDGFVATAAKGDDCDDSDENVHPGAIELQNKRDDDCDTKVDEGTAYHDDDNDGLSEFEGDCDDADPSVSPDMFEVDNGIDDDCDGQVDEGFNVDPDADPDNDGVSARDGDCEPDDADIWPGAVEVANGVDDDCDDTIDEETDYFDDDQDGFTEVEGDCDDADARLAPFVAETCDDVDEDCDDVIDEETSCYDDDDDGFTEGDGDCDDADPAVHPDALEVANGEDDDCDGAKDDGLGDADGDGLSAADGDCDEGNAAVFPGAVESCDGVDNNCDLVIDEACGPVDDTPSQRALVLRNPCGCNSDPNGLGAFVLALGALARRRRV